MFLFSKLILLSLETRSLNLGHKHSASTAYRNVRLPLRCWSRCWCLLSAFIGGFLLSHWLSHRVGCMQNYNSLCRKPILQLSWLPSANPSTIADLVIMAWEDGSGKMFSLTRCIKPATNGDETQCKRVDVLPSNIQRSIDGPNSKNGAKHVCLLVHGTSFP